jgi:iron complex transport system ATP-binding protein
VPVADGGLALTAVEAGYGERNVLRGVTLAAAPGEIVGLIGPNGSGKTTLVRVATRGLAPRSGSVRLNGEDPYRVSARRAAQLAAVVPQEMAPAFVYTVLEVVLMGRSPYLSPWGGGKAEDWSRARQAMVEANVQHLADRPLDRLSGGERQRVILAQALAQDAPILLLDEPTTHLDLRHVVDTLTLLWRLARSGTKAVLAIFHDLNLAAAYCDRVYVLDQGIVIESGAPGQVITTELIRTVFHVEAEVVPSPSTGLPTVVPAARPSPREPALSRAHVISGAGTGAAAMRAMAEAGFEVTAGVLHGGDTDDAVAQRLDLQRISVPPFSTVDEMVSAECWSLIKDAALVVLCDPPFGPGNIANLRLAVRAAERGTTVLILERTPVEDRDFTGGDATALWSRVAERAIVVRTETEMVRAAREAVGA